MKLIEKKESAEELIDRVFFELKSDLSKLTLDKAFPVLARHVKEKLDKLISSVLPQIEDAYTNPVNKNFTQDAQKEGSKLTIAATGLGAVGGVALAALSESVKKTPLNRRLFIKKAIEASAFGMGAMVIPTLSPVRNYILGRNRQIKETKASLSKSFAEVTHDALKNEIEDRLNKIKNAESASGLSQDEQLLLLFYLESSSKSIQGRITDAFAVSIFGKMLEGYGSGIGWYDVNSITNNAGSRLQ